MSASHTQSLLPSPFLLSGFSQFCDQNGPRRYGGSDFKVPSSTPLGSSDKGAEPPSKKFTGKGDSVYGNSSGEMAYLAAHHEPQGLPVPPEEHHAAVMWLSGESYDSNQPTRKPHAAVMWLSGEPYDMNQHAQEQDAAVMWLSGEPYDMKRLA